VPLRGGGCAAWVEATLCLRLAVRTAAPCALGWRGQPGWSPIRSIVRAGAPGTAGLFFRRGVFHARGFGQDAMIRAMTKSLTPVFRAAGTADIADVVALVESAYRGESGMQGWTTESALLDGQRTDAEEVAATLARPGSVILLAERGGRLVGCCHLERQGDIASFGMFAVDPTLQGGGVGKLVMLAAELIARVDWHCRAVEMTVIEQRSELIAFYERRGYSRTGQFKPFPYGDERFGIPRRDDLRFEVLRKRLVEAAA